MKKKFLALLIAHSSWLAAISQNIGIGTNNPQNKLHVAGGFRLDTLTGVGGAGLMRHDANGVVYGIKFSGNVTDVLRGDGTFGSGGGSGSNYWSANGADIYNSNTGNVGIGTTTPASRLHVNGEVTIDAPGPTLLTGAGTTELNRYLHLINSPNFRSASGLKAGGILVADSYDYANPGKNDLIVKGNVGIGIANPALTLDIRTPTFGGGTRTFSDGAANFIVETIGGTNSWAKYYVKTSSQQWSIGSSQNFNGNQLYFSNETAGAIRMAIMPNGNVGIGTTDPSAKLQVVRTTGGDGIWGEVTASASFGIRGVGNAFNTTGVYGVANQGQGVGVWGQADLGTGVFGLTNSGAGVYGRATGSGIAVYADGNAGQSRDKGGFVKATAYVNGDGALIRSYNGVNSGGISSGRRFTDLSGYYYVDFPFPINDRFYAVSVQEGNTGQVAVSYEIESPSRLRIVVTDLKNISNNAGTDRPVMVIVY